MKAGGEEDNIRRDGWVLSPTQWTSVWANSGSWWWTGKPDVLQSIGHKESDMTERLNWTELTTVKNHLYSRHKIIFIIQGFLSVLTELLTILLSFLTDDYLSIGLVRFSSVTQSCPSLCNPMDCSMTGFPVHHQHQELA